MFGSESLESFKENLIQVLQSSGHKPILASIGKQSKGKSYFLGHFLDDGEIPNKQNSHCSKGTHEFFSKSYNNYGFTLLDMEGFESMHSNTSRDSFNFCSVFTISEVLIMNISHEDLENQAFLDSFALNYWRYCKSAIKHRKKPLIIILAIRDPRFADEFIKVLKAYDDLVKGFTEEINSRMKSFTDEFISEIRPLLINDDVKEADIKIANEIICKINEDMGKYKFAIDMHFVVFFSKGFGKGKSKYFELKKIDEENVQFEESKFDSILVYIQQKCQEIVYMRNAESNYTSDTNDTNEPEIIYKLKMMIKEEEKRNSSKVNAIREIYVEACYDPMMRFPNKEGFLRSIGGYYRIHSNVEKINESVTKQLFKNLENTTKCRELMNEHKIKINEMMNNAGLWQIKEVLISYLKYLSAKCYCETLKLRNENPERPAYQYLIMILKFSGCENIINHQINEISKRKKMFSSLSFYDADFDNIIKHLYPKNVYLFESLFQVYLKFIEESIEFDYEYQEVINSEINKVQDRCYLSDLMKLLDNLYPSPEYDINQVEKFLKKLKNYHIECLMNKRDSLIKLERPFKPSQYVVEVHEKYDFIPAMYIAEKIIPSISGIIIGIASSATRALIVGAISEAAAATAAAATTAWIPIVGWTIFGVTTIASIGWIIYSYLKKTTSKNLKFKNTVASGFKIFKVIKNVKHINGTIVSCEDKLQENKKQFKSFIELKHEKVDPLSACVKATFYVIKIRD
ncbi:hypothetical protein SteCoe_8984 [Stentor coeruleus]|uniref:Uncharacterized protein n=1 Tax=Stentor coeruleus TaxID=5963 RepID=A0A1R2CIZ8_9CILI|nr:hypothetical protein SteCoe_8984 [Stentor coeruleus]